MGSQTIKTTEIIISCSNNGQHPLVYINLKSGEGACHYCGQKFVRVERDDKKDKSKAA